MSTNSKNKEHLTRSIMIGYITIIILAIGTGVYIFNLISRIANEKEKDNTAWEKVHIITNTLSLLYESETYTQFVTAPDEEFDQFTQTLGQVQEQLELLRANTPDTTKWGKIDQIEELLEQKHENTRQLLNTVKEIGGIYSRNLSKKAVSKNEQEKEVAVQKQEKTEQDTVVVQRQKKGFFKRLAEAFVPEKEDSTVIVNTTSLIQKDSLVSTYNSNAGDTINKFLDQIKKNIALEQSQLNQVLTQQTSKLRYNNNVITNEINQLLLEIEEEEMLASEKEEERKEELIHEASKRIAIIAFVSIVIVIIFMVIALRDISKSRYYRKQLEKAKLYAENLLQSRERLMLTISHDIRAPLSSILGYIDLLRKKPEKKQEEYVDNIQVSAKHILALVNDLLDFHRLDSGQMEIHPEPFNAPDLFNEIYSSFKPIADAKGLSFNMEIADANDPATYSGDVVRIRQIVNNLLSNAIKFTSKGEVSMHVSVADEEDNKTLKVAVKDEGTGIDKAEQEKIFDEFTRLAGSEKAEGFGLGLSITGKLVALMKGHISLESEPGAGSEFTVTIPLSLSEEERKEDSTPEETDPVIEFTNKINCLIVDDDMLQLKLTEELLKSSRVNVISLSDTNMVVNLLQNGKFDIILTDIQMPGTDGYTLLKQIRTSGVPGTENIPVVALSASNVKEESHYLEAGFTGFLVKPFTANDLISLLNRLFSTQLKTVDTLNISSLTSFAGDDREVSESILKTFTEETGKSIDLLKEALEKEDKELAAKVSHKLIPLFTMLEANALVQQLRLLEKEEEKLSADYWRSMLGEVIEQSTSLVEQILAGKK